MKLLRLSEAINIPSDEDALFIYGLYHDNDHDLFYARIEETEQLRLFLHHRHAEIWYSGKKFGNKELATQEVMKVKRRMNRVLARYDREYGLYTDSMYHDLMNSRSKLRMDIDTIFKGYFR